MSESLENVSMTIEEKEPVEETVEEDAGEADAGEEDAVEEDAAAVEGAGAAVEEDAGAGEVCANVDVSITCGDFNNTDVLSHISNAQELLSVFNNKFDYIFASNHNWEQRIDMQHIIPARHDSRRIQNQFYLKDVFERNRFHPSCYWSSDHAILVGEIVSISLKDSSECKLKVASWNIMSQGIRHGRKAWNSKSAYIQTMDAIGILATDIMDPDKQIDVVCLQEAGGNAWNNYFQPIKLTEHINEFKTWDSNVNIQMLPNNLPLPPADTNLWFLAKHKRDGVKHGEGTLTLVRSTCLDYDRLNQNYRTQESEIGKGGHSCLLPLKWKNDRGEPQTLNTHITNVHTFGPGDKYRPFTITDLLISLCLR